MSENAAALVSTATLLDWIIFICVAVPIRVLVLSCNVLFLPTSPQALHFLKLISSSIYLLIWRFLGCCRLRSNLIWLFDGWLLCSWRLFLLLGSLLILWILILRLVPWTHKSSVLVRSGLLGSITLVLVQIPWLFWLQTFLSNSLGDCLPWF